MRSVPLNGGAPRLRVVGAVFAAALFLAIPSSQAGTVKISVASTTVAFRAKPGEHNALVIPYPA